jgi:hypothetical protein
MLTDTVPEPRRRLKLHPVSDYSSRESFRGSVAVGPPELDRIRNSWRCVCRSWRRRPATFELMFESLTPGGVLAAALIAPPSAELIVALDQIDVRILDAGLQVDLMVAWERCSAWVLARQLPVIAVVGDTAFAAACLGLGLFCRCAHRPAPV